MTSIQANIRQVFGTQRAWSNKKLWSPNGIIYFKKGHDDQPKAITHWEDMDYYFKSGRNSHSWNGKVGNKVKQ